MINVHITKNGNESNANLLRRFQKKIKTSKIVLQAKVKQYQQRPLSPMKRKETTLNKINKIKKTQKLIKLGKITPKFNN